jgi:hypothetical protein
MADFGLDTLSDAELGQLAAHVAAASADARAQAGADMTDAQRDEINTIEMDAQEQWLRDRQETHGMNEPAAGYDDGENQAIPGGGREAFLKAKPERNPAYYTEIGHDPDRVKDSYMFVVGKDGRMRVVRVSDLQDIVSKNVDKHVETDRKGREVITYTLPGSQYDITYYTNDDGSINMDDLTHNDWEMATSVGSSQIWKNSIAFGRVEVRDGKPIVALGGLGYAHEGMTTEQIRSTVREAVEKAIRDGQITGANQRAVALDFSGSDGNGFDSGSPGAFEPGADYGDKRRRNTTSQETEAGATTLSVQDVNAVVQGNETLRALQESGRLVVIKDYADLVRMADQIGLGHLSRLELRMAYERADAWFDPKANKIVVFADKQTSTVQLMGDIVHEIIHKVRGLNPALVRELAQDILAAAETDPTAKEAIYRAAHAMLTEPEFADVIRALGGRFADVLENDISYEDFVATFSIQEISDLLAAAEKAEGAGQQDSFAIILAEEMNAYLESARQEARNAPEGSPERKATIEKWYQRLWSIIKDALRKAFGWKLSRSMHDIDRITREDFKNAAKDDAGQGDTRDVARNTHRKRKMVGNKRQGTQRLQTNAEVENEWLATDGTSNEPTPGTKEGVDKFKERIAAGSDFKSEMASLEIDTQITLPDGNVVQMPDDLVTVFGNNVTNSTGESPKAYDNEDKTKVERLHPGNFDVKNKNENGGIEPASVMLIDGRQILIEAHPLLNGSHFDFQVGVQLGSRDNNSGYGFQHGMKHALEMILVYALKTAQPGETPTDSWNRVTDNGKNGLKALADALEHFYKQADVKVALVGPDGKEIKVCLANLESGVQMNGRLTSSGTYSFTTAFHMIIPEAGVRNKDKMGNGVEIAKDVAKRESNDKAVLENDARYVLSFDSDRLFKGLVPAGCTLRVDVSRASDAVKAAMQKAVDNVGNDLIANASPQERPGLEQKKAGISIVTEPSKATETAAETHEKETEVAAETPEKGTETTVGDQIGGDVQSPAPTYPPVIPPSPPPAAPPGAAPVNPELTAAHKAWDIVTGRYFSGISVKAHQNARRFPGTSIQAVADMIHNRPGSQGSAAPRSIPASIMTARARYMNRFRDIMEPMRNHLAAMKDTATREAFYEKLTDIITGRRTDSGFVGQMAEDLKKLLADLHQYRVDAGEELGEVPDYFPAVYNSTMIAADRAGFLADAERAYRIELSKTLSGPELDATAAASALALYNTHVRGMGAEQFNMLFERSAPGGRENSAREREFGRQAQNIMRRWQAKDPFLVVSRYVAGAVKSAELARKFGADGSGWQKYAEGMEAEGVPHEVIQEMHQLVCQAAGVGIPGIGKRGQEFMDFVALYTAASALGKSFLSNLFEPVSMGIRTGSPLMLIRAYGETWTRSANEFAKDKTIIGMLHQDSFWQQYAEHIGTIHNSLEDAWMTTHSMELGMDNQNPRMRFLTNRIYKANLMDATETAKQQASHAIGHSYISDLCAMIDGSHWMNKFGMDASRSARRDLIELGVPEADHQAFISWMKTLAAAPAEQRLAIMTDGSPMSKLYEEAQVRFTNQTAVRANRAHRPVFQDNLMGKMFLQLQSFSYSYAAEANSRIYDNLKRSASTGDHTAADRMRLIAPAIMMPLGILAFMMMFALRDKLYPTEATKKHENDPWWASVLNAASYLGTFGPKVEQAMKFVMRDQPPGGVIGQHLINAARAVKGYATAQIGPEEKKPAAMASANKAAVKAAIPPLKGVAVAGASLANPTLGTVVQMGMNDTTLSNAAIEATQPEKPDKKREETNPYKHRNPNQKPSK